MNIYNNIKELESVGKIKSNAVINADCFDVFPCIEDKSVDMVLCDLPYG